LSSDNGASDEGFQFFPLQRRRQLVNGGERQALRRLTKLALNTEEAKMRMLEELQRMMRIVV
jgi:hypothetical protein